MRKQISIVIYNRPSLSLFFLLLLVFLACNSSINAQGFKKGQKRLSPYFGISLGNLRNNSSPGYISYETSFFGDQRVGMVGGTEFEYFIVDNLSLNLAGENVQRGIKLNSSLSKNLYQEDYDLELKNDYVIFPLTIRKYIIGNGFFVEGGLYFGFLFKSKIKSRYYISNENVGNEIKKEFVGSTEDSDKIFTNKNDFGMRLGIGHSFPISEKWQGRTKLSYDHGFQKVDGKYDQIIFFGSSSPTVGVPTGQSQTVKVASIDYYRMNPNAKNIYLALSFGASYRL